MPRRTLFILIASGFISVMTLLFTWSTTPLPYADNFYYKELAEGRSWNVVRPYSGRILHANTVRSVTNILPLNTDQAFLLVAIAALFTLTLVVTWILTAVGLHPAASVPIVFSPVLLESFGLYYTPDLFHAALVGIFFVLVFYENLWPAIVLVFFLCLTREWSILLGLSLVIVALHQRKMSVAVGTVVMTAVGIFVVTMAERLGQGNIHSISNVLYLALKVVYNFNLNILGLFFTTNTLNALVPGGFCENPIFSLAVPGWFPFGAIRFVSLCSFEPANPLRTAVYFLTSFGIGPTLLLFVLTRHRGTILKSVPMWLSIALIYGLVSFCAAPLVGCSVQRLFGYGWPAFWIAALPLLLTYYRVNNRTYARLGIYHVLACWVPWVVEYLVEMFGTAVESVVLEFVLFLALVIVLHSAAYRVLTKLEPATREAAGQRAVA